MACLVRSFPARIPHSAPRHTMVRSSSEQLDRIGWCPLLISPVKLRQATLTNKGETLPDSGKWGVCSVGAQQQTRYGVGPIWYVHPEVCGVHTRCWRLSNTLISVRMRKTCSPSSSKKKTEVVSGTKVYVKTYPPHFGLLRLFDPFRPNIRQFWRF